MAHSNLIVWSQQRDYARDREVVMILRTPNDEEKRLAISLVPMHPGDLIESEQATVQARGRNLEGIGGTEFLQTVLNHAWEIGLRPVGFDDTTRQVGAMENHLHDLRALIFRGDVKPRG